MVELKANDALGKPILKKMIGATKPPTITLKRAADASMDLWNWHKAALDGALVGARKDGSIVPATTSPTARSPATTSTRLDLQVRGDGHEGRRQHAVRRERHDRLRATRADQVTWSST